MFKESGVDRVILGMNAGKDYNVNEAIEFFKTYAIGYNKQDTVT